MLSDAMKYILLMGLLLSLQVKADPRLIIHLTDYLANDYSGAVGEDGKILSEGEYAEQIEFSKVVTTESLNDPDLQANSELINDVKALESFINTKTPPSLVIPLARKIQKSVIKLSKIELAPKNWPDYKKAKELFQQNCVSCHGQNGRGDGPDGRDLDPKPANFHDLERAPTISPFAGFNTIRLGVPGTGMPSFDFSDEDVWTLAFYVNTFRFQGTEVNKNINPDSLDDELLSRAATLNDRDLSSYLKEKGVDPQVHLASIRLHGISENDNKNLNRARALLNLSVESFNKRNYKHAQQLALSAYFEGIEPIENKIKANDPKKVTLIEGKMSEFRMAIKNLDRDRLIVLHEELKVILDAVEPYMREQKITKNIAFVSGFSIILREGFEAVLVIVAILGVAKLAGSQLVTFSIHLGWIVSLLVGCLGWFLSGWLISISGYGRELIEGLTSLFAVFVLIYVGFWMHRQTEIQRWKEFINVKVKNLVQAKNLIGLFALSFIVSFREVIETVLFLRTIYSESKEEAHTYLLLGVISAFTIVIIVAILLSKFRKKIPLQHFFNFSAILMMFLSVVLSGKGIHALQEAGVINVYILESFPRFELVGVYPSLQVFATQLVIGIFCIYIWIKGKKKS